MSAKNPIEAFLQRAKVMALDGGLATELERRGVNLDDPLWSAKLLIQSPELIRKVHLAYFLAGADLATTASYQATFEAFARRGLDEAEAERLMRLSLQLACEARDEFWSKAENRAGRLRPLVAASVGPYGAYLADGSEYRGDYGLSKKELMDFHRPRMKVLANAGADLLAFETIPCLEEVRALVELLREFPGCYAWLSFSCRDGESLNHDEPIEAAAALANETPQIAAVGVNCTAPHFMEDLLKRAAKVTAKPLLAYPNSGEVWDKEQKCWLPHTGSADWTALAIGWPAKLIGGCCRTTPEDIRHLKSRLAP